jgi:ABC-type nitrate/sulfonate/bicarbonate transport system permease component
MSEAASLPVPPPPAPSLRLWLLRGRASGVLLILLLLALWEASARLGWVASANWPPFTRVLAALWQDSVTGELPLVVLGTLWRMAAGLAWGSAAGVACGLLLALWPFGWRILEPAVELLRPIPVPAIVPPLVLFLGLDDPMKITCVAVAAFFPVLTNTLQGFRAVEPVQLDMARTFRISRARAVLRIMLPATLPWILGGVRVALGLALVVTVVAEMIAGEAGLGHYLVMMQFALRAPEMYAAILLLAAVGYALNRAFLLLEGRAIHWYHATGRGEG